MHQEVYALNKRVGEGHRKWARSELSLKNVHVNEQTQWESGEVGERGRGGVRERGSGGEGERGSGGVGEEMREWESGEARQWGSGGVGE